MISRMELRVDCRQVDTAFLASLAQTCVRGEMDYSKMYDYYVCTSSCRSQKMARENYGTIIRILSETVLIMSSKGDSIFGRIARIILQNVHVLRDMT
jgi:hypothetical protein